MFLAACAQASDNLREGNPMKILLTGHQGYIGAVAGPMMRAAGHDVVGLDTDFFAGCDFGTPAESIPGIHKDVRDVAQEDLKGFDAVVHLGSAF